MIGRYIDALDDEGRDRLLQAQGWCSWGLADLHGNRCLRGHAEFGVRPIIRGTGYMSHEWQKNYVVCPRTGGHVPERFNRAFDRWGDRLIRAIKQRAAKHNHITLDSVVPEREHAQVTTW